MVAQTIVRYGEADEPAYRFPESSPFYSRPQVLELVPVTYACLWGWMRDGNFPQAREIGPGGKRCKIGWLKKEVDDWINDRPARVQKPRMTEEEVKATVRGKTASRKRVTA